MDRRKKRVDRTDWHKPKYWLTNGCIGVTPKRGTTHTETRTAQNKFRDTAKGGVFEKHEPRGCNVDPVVCSRRILMIVSKKLSNETRAVGMQPARTSQKTSQNRHSANAPMCTVFVRYKHSHFTFFRNYEVVINFFRYYTLVHIFISFPHMHCRFRCPTSFPSHPRTL